MFFYKFVFLSCYQSETRIGYKKYRWNCVCLCGSQICFTAETTWKTCAFVNRDELTVNLHACDNSAKRTVGQNFAADSTRHFSQVSMRSSYACAVKQ